MVNDVLSYVALYAQEGAQISEKFLKLTSMIIFIKNKSTIFVELHCILKDLFINEKWFLFTARCYASAVIAVGLCPSVSVRLSQVGVLSKRCKNRAGFWHVSFLPPVLHCVKKFGYLQI